MPEVYPVKNNHSSIYKSYFGRMHPEMGTIYDGFFISK